jgi:elongation factor P
MLEYNEITVRKYIVIDGQPYEVVDNHIFRMQQRKPQNKTKLRNLITGSIKDMTFHASDKVEEADIDTKEVKYIYSTKGENWFCDKENPAKRFKLTDEILGEGMKFIKPNSIIEALLFDDGESEEAKIIGIKLPVKVELKVTEAHPAVKGDTAKGGNKLVTLETGATLNVPMFINEGDVLRINTETGDYVERA